MEKLDFKQFWKTFWKMIVPFHKKIRSLVFVILAAELVRLIGPYIFKVIIDTISTFQRSDVLFLLLLTGTMFLSNQLLSLIGYLRDRKIFEINPEVEIHLLKKSHQKMMAMDLEYHARENTGNKIVKVQRGADQTRNLLGNLFWEVLPTLFQLFLTIIVLFVVDWRFGLTVLFFAPMFIFITLKLNFKIFKKRRKRMIEQERSFGVMGQSIMNINTVKSFVQEKQELKTFDSILKKVMAIFRFEYKNVLNYNLLRVLVLDLNRVFIVLFGIYLISNGAITIGSLVFAFTISEKAFLSLFRISRLYDQIMESSEAVKRIHNLFGETPAIKSPKNGIKPDKLEGEIKFENVHYQYEESGNFALNGVSTKILPDSVVALVGPSGGGKTTLARMIYRHYDPNQGKVLLDGKDLKLYDLDSFRRHIAIVPQEVEIFNATVRQNISYAKPKSSLEEIEAAARIANAEEFIKQLKKGYQTLVGERGIKLSGGQRQRIGIARAILANPKVLIFDEATSNLDSHSEKLIQQAIDKVSRNRTMIIIAHRLSTIKKADKIIVLEQGKVVEEGNHLELAQNDGGLYRKLLVLQELGDID